MQTTESDVGPSCRLLLQWEHHHEHLMVCHGVLDYNGLCLCRHAFCHSVESSDEEETKVHNRRHVESWLLVSCPAWVDVQN